MRGVGISFRPEFLPFWDEIYLSCDCFEFIPDELVHNERLFRDTSQALGNKPRMAHSTCLSVGSIERLDKSFLDSLVKVTKTLKADGVSDHMSFRRAQGIEIDNFCLPLDDAVSLSVLSENLQYYEKMFGEKISLENITVNGLLSSSDFFHREINLFKHHCDTGGEILLDVNNLFINSVNFGLNIEEYLESFPLSSVKGIHIAGHEGEDWIVDTHMNRVSDDVLHLLGTVLARSPAEFVILERDNDSASRDEILEDLDRIFHVWNAVR